MRLLNRQKNKIFFKNLMATQDAINEDGLRTGEKETVYSDFKVAYVSISIAKSLDSFEPFGTSLNYDYTMYCDDMNCEIDENTLIWLNNSVEEKHDLIVLRKAKSLNHIIYAVRRID